MRIQVIGWKSQGLRCPDMDIDLHNDKQVPKISLIQMPNGTGKTTTLTCLRACFDGSAEKWVPEDVRKFFAPGAHRDKAMFSTRLLLNESKRLTITLTFHYADGIVSYSTTSGKDNRPGFTPPDDAALFLNNRFSHLFVFDGELAQELLEGKKADAGSVIDTFFQLYLLKDLDELAQQAFLEHAKRRKAVNPTAKAKLEGELEALQKRQKALASQFAKTQKRAADATHEQKELEADVGKKIAENKELLEREKNAETLLANAEHSLDLSLQTLGAVLPNPFLFGKKFQTAISTLADSLDRLKLPETSSRAFFEELASGKECVCGRQLAKEHKDTIRQKAKSILGDEIAGFLNAFKQDAKSVKAQKTTQFLSDHLALLKEHASQRDKAITQKNAIRAGLSSDAEVKKKEQRLAKLAEDLNMANDFIEDYQREPLPTDDINCSCAKWFTREIQSKTKTLAELTGSLDYKNRTEAIQEILRSAYDRARAALKKTTIMQANARLKKVLPLSPVRIHDIDTAIHLANEAGVEQAGASTGQTLAVGYVFLTTLLNGGTHQFPLIVDSPANPLDITVRKEVAPLIPELCSQFIAFIISSERAGFLKSLVAAARDDIKFWTAFRKTPTIKKLVTDLPKQGVLQTDNGVLVEGKNYFMQFDLDTET